MADLRSLADDLASTIAEQFSATFQAVDREFNVFFQRLFNGGQGALPARDDPDQPGSGIYPLPPGKSIGPPPPPGRRGGRRPPPPLRRPILPRLPAPLSPP